LFEKTDNKLSSEQPEQLSGHFCCSPPNTFSNISSVIWIRGQNSINHKSMNWNWNWKMNTI